MSFHFCCHSWEVRDMDDGTLVKLTNRDLDKETIPVLVDELFEIVQESGRPALYLDFGAIRLLPSLVLGKMISLDAKLREHGCRLILTNVDPLVYETFQATRLAEVLDIRPEEVIGSIA
jgi:anti-anti-sigma factor